VLPHLNAIYYDLKLMDSEDHRAYCGVPNERILANFKRLVELSRAGTFDLQPRIPLVPDITATEENLTAIGRFLLDVGVRQVRLLDYNPTWVDKGPQLGIANKFTELDIMRTWLPRGLAARLRQHLVDLGLEAI
jgi:pyruvate formate lyase activating enzyme